MSKFSTASVNAIADAWGALLNGGSLELYTGAAPATADDATAETLLVTLTLPGPAFAAAVDGVITLNAVTPVGAAASGDAGWGRLKKSDGTALYDGAVATSVTPFIIDAISILSGEDVTVSAFTFTQPKS